MLVVYLKIQIILERLLIHRPNYEVNGLTLITCTNDSEMRIIVKAKEVMGD